MSKVNIDNVSVEVIGTTVHLRMPSHYSLSLNSTIVAPAPIGLVEQTYVPIRSSLAQQIDQVEKSGNGFWNK